MFIKSRLSTSRKRLSAAVLVAAVGSALAFASPAAAHDQVLYLGSNYAVQKAHSHINAYDRECDGRSIYVEWFDHYGFHRRSVGGDCGSWAHFDGTYITDYRLCESGTGCTPWIRA